MVRLLFFSKYVKIFFIFLLKKLSKNSQKTLNFLDIYFCYDIQSQLNIIGCQLTRP